jgi:hypothetical protein
LVAHRVGARPTFRDLALAVELNADWIVLDSTRQFEVERRGEERGAADLSNWRHLLMFGAGRIRLSASVTFDPHAGIALFLAMTVGGYSMWLAGSPIYMHDAGVRIALHVRSIAATWRDSNATFLPLYFHMPSIGDNVWFHPMIVYFSAIFLKGPAVLGMVGRSSKRRRRRGRCRVYLPGGTASVSESSICAARRRSVGFDAGPFLPQPARDAVPPRRERDCRRAEDREVRDPRMKSREVRKVGEIVEPFGARPVDFVVFARQ